MKRNNLVILCLLSLIVSFAACKQASVPPQATDSSAGTNSTDTPNGKNSPAAATKIYPHSEEFLKGGHGAIFLQDKSSCTKCHGKDYSGPSPETSCKKCHGEKFPHSTAWGLPENHGEFFKSKAEDPKARAACLTCHQSQAFDEKAKKIVQFQHKSGVYCVSCHEVYPHNEVIADDGDNFSDGNHAAFKKVVQNQALCMACHKNVNVPGGDPDCKMCHKNKTLNLKWQPIQQPAPAPNQTASPAPNQTATPAPSAKHVKKDGSRMPSANIKK